MVVTRIMVHGKVGHREDSTLDLKRMSVLCTPNFLLKVVHASQC